MAENEIDITIVFPTYNRVKYLSEAVESIIRQIKDNEWIRAEILIVDNNSIDDTAGFARDASLKNPDIVLRYVQENNQGLSYARNRGISEAKGELIAFADDDIEFEDNWLENCIRIMNDRKDIDILGGPVLPYRIAIPEWLPPRYLMLVGLWAFDGGLQEIKNVPGGNCCIRRRVPSAIGGFNPALGRCGKILLMGEENDYFARARKNGFHIYASPDLLVYHKIANKLQQDYIIQNAIAAGAGLHSYDKIEHQWTFCFAKSIYYLGRYILLQCLSIMNEKKGIVSIAAQIDLNYARGYIRGVHINNERIS